MRLSPTRTRPHFQYTTTSKDLNSVYLWSTDSEDRDFRDETWTSKKIAFTKDKGVSQKITFPSKGYKAFYIDLEYKDPNGGTYTKSTRMYVADDDEIL